MKEIVATAERQPLENLRLPDSKSRGIIDSLVGFWPNDGSAVVLRREATAIERGHLRMRQRDLHMLLRPLSLEDRKHAAKALAAMFLGFPNLRTTEHTAIVTAYIMALEQYPLFAIIEACEDVVRGRVDDLNPDFAPTAPRLCDLATRHVLPLRAELAVVEKALTAKYEINPVSPEERERIAVKLRELADAMMERDKVQRREHLIHQAVVLQEANTKALLDEYRRLGIDPVYADADQKILLSPQLAGKAKL
jgi:hypothetical protein